MTTTEPQTGASAPMLRHDRVTTAATAGIIGAVITLGSALVVYLVVQPDTTVSDEQFSYPWSASALIPVSILYLAAHLLVAAGLVAVRRRGVGSLTSVPQVARFGETALATD